MPRVDVHILLLLLLNLELFTSFLGRLIACLDLTLKLAVKHSWVGGVGIRGHCGLQGQYWIMSDNSLSDSDP